MRQTSNLFESEHLEPAPLPMLWKDQSLGDNKAEW